MSPNEILRLSAAIARRVAIGELSLGSKVVWRRGTELSLVPRDTRHANVLVELDPQDNTSERVKGVRIRLVQPEKLLWGALTDQFGPFTDQAEISGRPEVAPTRVATARPADSLPQTIRISVEHDGNVSGFVVREHSV